jgi:hypothetical protein
MAAKKKYRKPATIKESLTFLFEQDEAEGCDDYIYLVEAILVDEIVGSLIELQADIPKKIFIEKLGMLELLGLINIFRDGSKYLITWTSAADNDSI